VPCEKCYARSRHERTLVGASAFSASQMSKPDDFWILRASRYAAKPLAFARLSRPVCELLSRFTPALGHLEEISLASPLIIAVHSGEVSKRNELFIAVDPRDPQLLPPTVPHFLILLSKLPEMISFSLSLRPAVIIARLSLSFAPLSARITFIRHSLFLRNTHRDFDIHGSVLPLPRTTTLNNSI